MFKKGFKFGLGLVVGLEVMDYAMGLILHKMNDQNKNHTLINYAKIHKNRRGKTTRCI